MAWVAEHVVTGQSTRSAVPRPADTIALLSTLLSVLPSPGITYQRLGRRSLSERLALGGLLPLREDVNYQLGNPLTRCRGRRPGSSAPRHGTPTVT